MLFSENCAILFPVSERKNNMKNETFKCENCNETHPIEARKEYGWRDVCPECELHLSDEFERIGKIALEKVEKKLDLMRKM